MNAIRDRGFIEGVVCHLPLLSALTPVTREAVAGHCWALAAPRGAELLRAGMRPPGIFALAYGSVKLSLSNGHAGERLLRLVTARQVFGEASALLDRASPYDAVALQESKVVVIPTEPLLALVDRDPRFARGLVASLALGKLELCAEVGSATLHTGVERLAGYLLHIEREGSVRLPSSKTLVAARLGMKKETLSRLLGRLVRQGAIAVRGRDIAILDRAQLREVAS